MTANPFALLTACVLGTAFFPTVFAAAESATSQLNSHQLDSDFATAETRLEALFSGTRVICGEHSRK